MREFFLSVSTSVELSFEREEKRGKIFCLKREVGNKEKREKEKEKGKMVGSGTSDRSKEAVGMMALHEALRSVCLNTDWTYSVFWTIRPRPYVSHASLFSPFLYLVFWGSSFFVWFTFIYLQES